MFHQAFSPIVAPSKTSLGWEIMLTAKARAQADQKSLETWANLIRSLRPAVSMKKIATIEIKTAMAGNIK